MAKRVDKKKRQAELLAIAIEVFAERGYQATTMEEIAERAGVSKGMLYLYFKNKEALFGAVFRWFGRTVGERMAEEMEEAADEVEQLRGIARAWGAVAGRYREYVPLFLDFWAVASVKGLRNDYAGDLADLYVEYRATITGIIERGKASGRFRAEVDAEVVAYLLVGGMDGLFIQSWLASHHEPERLVNSAMEVVIGGMIRP